MRMFFSFLTRLFMIASLSLLIMSCSRVSQANYDKIKPQMTMDEVVAILGEPSNTDSVNIAGISGTAATWKDQHAEINIQFLNNQVAVKTFNKVGKNESQ